MYLIIDEYGTFIGKKENRFEIKRKEKTEEFSADLVKQIIISSASSISTGAIKLAMENGIDIVYLGKFGEPKARIYPCHLGGTTLTRKKQLEAYFSEKGLILAKKFIEAKIENQANLLKSLAKTRDNAEIRDKAEKILEFSSKLDGISGNLDKVRENILGIEGYSASEYFSCLSLILPVQNRERNAQDYFNILLNYGYGILYSEVERACILAGLDPYFGFLHTDRYGKPSMVLDLIEEFRAPIVDRAVINLFVKKQIKDEDFEKVGDKLILSKSGKKKIIEAVMEKLHNKTESDNKEKRILNIIVEQARKVTRFVLEESENYEPFVMK